MTPEEREEKLYALLAERTELTVEQIKSITPADWESFYKKERITRKLAEDADFAELHAELLQLRDALGAGEKLVAEVRADAQKLMEEARDARRLRTKASSLEVKLQLAHEDNSMLRQYKAAAEESAARWNKIDDYEETKAKIARLEGELLRAAKKSAVSDAYLAWLDAPSKPVGHPDHPGDVPEDWAPFRAALAALRGEP